MRRTLLFDALADLLAYPDVEYRHHLAKVTALLRALRHEGFTDTNVLMTADALDAATEALDAFSSAIQGCSTADLEELYTRSFDINPACALELGWHLHGESYDRGAFLVRMRSLLSRFELTESGELPDHICHALAVFSRMPESEASVFARECLRPSLVPMREALGKAGNPYDNVLAAVQATLHTWCAQPTGVQTA